MCPYRLLGATPLVRIIVFRSIEDDVQQNKEDIIDLRLTDGRHDMLISHAMADTKYINSTIIPGDFELFIDNNCPFLKCAFSFHKFM